MYRISSKKFHPFGKKRSLNFQVAMQHNMYNMSPHLVTSNRDIARIFGKSVERLQFVDQYAGMGVHNPVLEIVIIRKKK